MPHAQASGRSTRLQIGPASKTENVLNSAADFQALDPLSPRRGKPDSAKGYENPSRGACAEKRSFNGVPEKRSSFVQCGTTRCLTSDPFRRQSRLNQDGTMAAIRRESAVSTLDAGRDIDR